MTTAVDNPLFVDTNILIYATDPPSPWYDPARKALQETFAQGDTHVLSPQILREFLAAASRGYRTGIGSPLPRVLSAIAAFRSRFTLVDENEAVVTALLTLVQQVPVGGKQIHDANIVATMQTHAIRRLLTNNEGHFARYSHVISVVPLRTFL